MAKRKQITNLGRDVRAGSAPLRRNSFRNPHLAGLRDALLPKPIRGELRVKDAEWFLENKRL